MRRFAVIALTLVVLLSGAPLAAALEVTFYTDRAAWENACVGPFFTEDFSDDLLNPGVSYTSSSSGNISNGFYHDVLQSTNPNEPMTTWFFTPSIVGFGGNWDLGGPGGSGPSLLVFVNDLSTYVGAIPNSYEGGFWGFIADTPFNAVLLQGGPGDHQQHYKLDNMSYCQVPLPGAFWLAAGGLLSLLVRRRRLS